VAAPAPQAGIAALAVMEGVKVHMPALSACRITPCLRSLCYHEFAAALSVEGTRVRSVVRFYHLSFGLTAGLCAQHGPSQDLTKQTVAKTAFSVGSRAAGGLKSSPASMLGSDPPRPNSPVVLQKPSSAATHLLTSSYTDLPADRQGMPHAQVVSVAWLEACMSAQTRVSESSYKLEPSGQSE
jgi:hypothetical protein